MKRALVAQREVADLAMKQRLQHNIAKAREREARKRAKVKAAKEAEVRCAAAGARGRCCWVVFGCPCSPAHTTTAVPRCCSNLCAAGPA